jgi:hypothetical protein
VESLEGSPKEATMKLSAKALAIAGGLLWGGGVLVLGLTNLASPTYGKECLQLISSVYPGFHNSRTFGDVLVGTGYGIVDGGICGFVFAWLYNLLVGRVEQAG